jgi:hypothetical protein
MRSKSEMANTGTSPGASTKSPPSALWLGLADGELYHECGEVGT